VPCPVAAGDFVSLERETGIAVLDHHLILSGVCRTCRDRAIARGDADPE
jgi:hypothetical protein